jgi:CRISPR-associated protein Cmr5
MARQTLEQQRALYALQTIQSHTTDADTDKSRYATLVRSLPSMVLQNGLGQALAYLLADAGGARGKPAGRLYAELEQWLAGDVAAGRPEPVYKRNSDLIEVLMAGSRSQYQRAQVTSLALLAWMRKFADAYLPKGD